MVPVLYAVYCDAFVRGLLRHLKSLISLLCGQRDFEFRSEVTTTATPVSITVHSVLYSLSGVFSSDPAVVTPAAPL